MSENLIRIYQKNDVNQIKPHLMIWGDLSVSCAHCQKMEVPRDATHCPSCQTKFHYITFRQVKSHIPKIHKLMKTRPQLTIIDFDDYSHALGSSKAQDFFK